MLILRLRRLRALRRAQRRDDFWGLLIGLTIMGFTVAGSLLSGGPCEPGLLAVSGLVTCGALVAIYLRLDNLVIAFSVMGCGHGNLLEPARLLLANWSVPCKYLRMDADRQAHRLAVDSEYVELAAEVFAMLADPTRIRLILALRDREMSVNELAEVVGKTGPSTSQHLAKMRLSRMVSTRQDGNKIFYRLENEHARELVVNAVFQAEHVLGGVPAHHQPTGSVQ